ncbi:hypothetical protein EW026_g6723 [Hermanssonia centrifuga]|uniref:Uncharacterized protein n=1 Tax=Hermanssonia centrifuga TaxID=98765 RepID=A0A4S4KB27_9APHY|nr:hypothetical protein EW026_g6723 [Hermanssonia centrifuga]
MNATTQYLTQDTPPRYTAISILIVFIVAIADCFMIYRLYIVWNRNLWIIALPAILEAGVIGLGLTVSVLLSRGNGSIPAAAEVWGAATLAVTMLSFFITTNLVAYKVWRSRRTLRSAGAHLTSSTSVSIMSFEFEFHG